MASLPVVIFQFALCALQGLAAARLGGALIITFAVLGAEHHGPRASPEQRFRNDARHHRNPCVIEGGRLQRKNLGPRPAVLLRRDAGPEGHQPAALRAQGDGLHRPVRLRQVHAAARAQPHVRPLPGPARRRRGAARRREHPVAAPGPQPAPRPRRHGVPEADAVSDVDLRQHRLRHRALRKAGSNPTWTGASRTPCAAPRCGTR